MPSEQGRNADGTMAVTHGVRSKNPPQQVRISPGISIEKMAEHCQDLADTCNTVTVNLSLKADEEGVAPDSKVFYYIELFTFQAVKCVESAARIQGGGLSRAKMGKKEYLKQEGYDRLMTQTAAQLSLALSQIASGMAYLDERNEWIEYNEKAQDDVPVAPIPQLHSRINKCRVVIQKMYQYRRWWEGHAEEEDKKYFGVTGSG